MLSKTPPAARLGLIGRTLGGSRTGKILAASAAALAMAALYNIYRSRQVERQHPPAGRFIDVDGVRLHYLERGEGTPVVLLHGNVVTAEDWILSGVFERLAERHRVIAFDRPGYGYSARPQGSPWTAAAQADLLGRALTCLGIEHPIVVGHSWGTNVALALALAEPTAVRGL
ncbi:alpha/beta fold hydrolase, partial [Geminicoccus harenae]|uniref:alpha/beta fold hydrolase n=1 Tax=Geminicoccus harenae TaxID=2498453 RepID=UPI001CC2BB6B